jgi:hypothetical protein
MSQNSINSLPPNLREMVERELKPEEQLRWVGQQFSADVVGEMVFTFVFAIIFTLFSSQWIYLAAKHQNPEQWHLTGLIVPSLGVPFFLFGLTLFCYPLVLWCRRKKTVYAITDRRAIVFAGGLFSMEIVSYQPDKLGKILREQKPNDGGVGDILFTGYTVPTEQYNEILKGVQVTIKQIWAHQTHGFLKIEHVKEVEQMLKDLAAQGTPTEEQSQLDVLQTQQSIGAAQRSLPLSVRLYLRLRFNPMSDLYWAFAVFGFTLALILIGSNGLDDTIPRIWVDAGKGKITNVEHPIIKVGNAFTIQTNPHRVKYENWWNPYNTKKIIIRIDAYHFEVMGNGSKKISGISYGDEGKYKIGDEVSLRKVGRRYCVKDLTLTKQGRLFSLIILFAFGVLGLGTQMKSWSAGEKAVRLLQYGLATHAKYVGMNTDGSNVINVDFEYHVNGKTYTVTAQAKNPSDVRAKDRDISRLTDTEYKEVLYDPEQPDRAVVLDGLPRNIHYDKATGQFGIDPKHLRLPLAAVVIVCCEIVAILVLGLSAI